MMMRQADEMTLLGSCLILTAYFFFIYFCNNFYFREEENSLTDWNTFPNLVCVCL